MKRVIVFFFTAFALCCGIHAQNTLTVCDKPTISDFIPIYGEYLVMEQRTQLLYSDSMLTDMRGMDISQMTLYTSTGYSSLSWDAVFSVSIAVVTPANGELDTFSSTTLTTVYQGTLSVSNNLMTINFNSDFSYPATGGDLLVDFATMGGSTNNTCGFLGRADTTHGKIYLNYLGMIDIIFPNDILPKVSFTYNSPSTCPRPQDLEATEVTTNSIGFEWSEAGSSSQWQYVCLTALMDSGSVLTPTTVDTTTATVSGLAAGTTYHLYVRSLCSATEQSNWTGPLTVTTLLCSNPCPMFIAMGDDYGDGWNGGLLIAEQGGITTTFEMPYGYSGVTVETGFCPFDSVYFHWSSGNYDEEVSFAFFDGDSNLLYLCNLCNPNDGDLVLAYFPVCGEMPVCHTPSQVTATHHEGEIVVDWTPMGDEQAWNIEVANLTHPSQTVLTVFSHPYTHTVAVNDDTFAIRVRARCSNYSQSEWSESVSVVASIPVDTVCHTPVNLQITDISWIDTKDISWTPVGNEGTWQVFIEQQDLYNHNVLYDTIVTVNIPSYTYTFEINTHNIVKVRAVCDEYGYSDWSEPVTFDIEHIGIDEVDNNTRVSLYPNPAKECAVVEVEGYDGQVNVSLYNLGGRKVRNANTLCVSGCRERVTLEGLSKGTYLVRISGEGIDVVRRLVIE